MAIVACDACCDIKTIKQNSPRPRLFVSPILLLPKKLIEDCVFQCLKAKNGEPTERALEEREWLEREVDPHDKDAWIASFSWCCTWLGTAGLKALFWCHEKKPREKAAMRGYSYRTGSFPGRKELAHELSKLREGPHGEVSMEECRRILLQHIDEVIADRRKKHIVERATLPQNATTEIRIGSGVSEFPAGCRIEARE